MTGTTSSDEEIYAGQVDLKSVYWFKPTSAGHLCTLKDKNGVEIIPMNALVANDSQMWPIYKRVESIHCDDMDSGTLYIYLR